jgi:hypothetical protein
VYILIGPMLWIEEEPIQDSFELPALVRFDSHGQPTLARSAYLLGDPSTVCGREYVRLVRERRWG